jgi:urease accessory protein
VTVERVIGRVGDAGGVDWVEIDWSQTVRRALRLTSRAGLRVNVQLPRGHETLRDGDVLAEVGGATLAVRVRPTPLLRMRPATMGQMGRLCAELGNQHVPLAVDEDVVTTLDDGPIRELADRFGVTWSVEVGPFHPSRSSVLAAEVNRVTSAARQNA